MINTIDKFYWIFGIVFPGAIEAGAILVIVEPFDVIMPEFVAM
jgi:hypothetical protein